ncbi:unnamed protein product [Adineta ricciae]|uniref:Uncharacterized protein n=1 Tax=Adineta ricciae TaxID=249248 RepID=A0A813S836_ADIRI|nr:unnamed protein product [Adineta ricciae]CAF1235803.1 unnamed protein product [Adineta ricciae]
MTVLPFLDIKATPVQSLDTALSSRQSAPETALPPCSSTRLTSSKRVSITPIRIQTPKIKILPRSDTTLRHLPVPKSAAVQAHNGIWKPLIREPADYDYLWEPLQREDIRHQYDQYVPPQRLTTSRPDEPYRMSSRFETQDRHFHNYRRTQAMQQKQWNKDHIQYTIYPYSQIAERESYNKYMRTSLKEQIKEKIQFDKTERGRKNLECQSIIEKDRQDLEQYKQKQQQRAKYLLEFTTKNKELMENKWAHDRWNRVHQWHVERVILADDPINWSKTLT